MNTEAVVRRPGGRPRAIPEELIPKVMQLHHQGYGYRSIARQLEDWGLSVDWSTIRRRIKEQSHEAESKCPAQMSCDTVLPLGTDVQPGETIGPGQGPANPLSPQDHEGLPRSG